MHIAVRWQTLRSELNWTELYNCTSTLQFPTPQCTYTHGRYSAVRAAVVWRWTAIVTAYTIEWLVCITGMESVYCAVRTEYLDSPRGNWRVFTSRYGLNIYIHLEELGECLLRGTDWISRFASRNLESVYFVVRTEYIDSPRETWKVFTSRYGLNIYIHLEELGECLLRGTDWIFSFTSTKVKLAGRTVASVVSPQARVRFRSGLVRCLADKVLLE